MEYSTVVNVGDFSSSLMGMLDSMGDHGEPGEQTLYHCSIDDFATCENDGICGFAGYVAPKEAWNRFNTHWDAALNDFGLKYLHTADFLSNFPFIGGRRDDDDDYLALRPFLSVVRGELLQAGGFGIIVVTECAGYDALSKEERKWIPRPFRHSFEMLIGAVCLEVSPSLGRHNPIAFQVDYTDVPRTALDLLVSFIRLKKQNHLYRESLGAITFADDKMLRPLQAADMLGNLALKAWRRQRVDKYWPKAAIAAISKDEKIPPYARSYDENILRSIANARRERGMKGLNNSDVNVGWVWDSQTL